MTEFGDSAVVTNNTFFEGPEKTLEVWFKPVEGKTLRNVPQEQWVPMLDLVNCKILSSVCNERCNAYLLSESSFFVFDSMALLKTCGTTTLLHSVQLMLEIAASVGLVTVQNVYYSRQNFFFPTHQLAPHGTFKDECALLKTHFGEGGRPLMLGTIDGNHYKFYNWETTPPSSQDDTSFEILMTGLHPERMREYFYKSEEEKKNVDVGRRCGIESLLQGLIAPEDFENQKIDEFIFDPFGYSMNALLGSVYFTIHVTPQDICSYASFETNLKVDDYSELARRVLDIFRPSDFMIVYVGDLQEQFKWKMGDLTPQYNRNERCFYEFETFIVHYLSFGLPADKRLRGSEDKRLRGSEEVKEEEEEEEEEEQGTCVLS